MRKLLLLRLTKDPNAPQHGVLFVDGKPRMVTLEPPWKNNEPSISCIPTGKYTCIRRTSTKTGGAPTFQITPVSGRDAILFHPGNKLVDTQGCVLPGTRFGWIDDKPFVFESREAFSLLMKLLDGVNECSLEIVSLWDKLET